MDNWIGHYEAVYVVPHSLHRVSFKCVSRIQYDNDPYLQEHVIIFF